MTNTLITAEELKDLNADELRSKFFRVSSDVAELRKSCCDLPLAEESLRNIGCELSRRRSRAPRS